MKLYSFIMCLSIAFQTVTLKNTYYKLNLPELTVYEKMNSSYEKESYVDVLKIINSENKQVKFLMYLMANKLNAETISKSDIKLYTNDLGNLQLFSTEKVFFNDKQYYKSLFKIDDNISGIMFLTNVDGVLYRILFMVPNKLFSEYQIEIDEILRNTSLLQTKWQ